ncbi:MAG TPA: SDR family NAD(P)-dependent oxidoreductase [Polyangiaceae bacterium]|nr:SDR family NAD(P)-dependent oxidoreductase [Polyangiaceae bacterium]
MSSAVEGKQILITGATGGIGLLAARAMLRAGALVSLHGRDEGKLARAAAELAPDGKVGATLVADLASLAEVAELAERVARELPQLEVLVNNAGVGFGADRRRRELSRDGFELRWAVNYLAPFLLTERLLAGGLPRRAVINVASIGQEPIDFSDLQSERDYEGTRAYRRSKLALILWSMDLAAQQPERVVHSLHPGTLLDTNMVRDAGVTPHGPASRGAEVILGVVERALRERESGLYFDELTPARAKPPAYDLQQRRKLREATLALLPR